MYINFTLYEPPLVGLEPSRSEDRDLPGLWEALDQRWKRHDASARPLGSPVMSSVPPEFTDVVAHGGPELYHMVALRSDVNSFRIGDLEVSLRTVFSVLTSLNSLILYVSVCKHSKWPRHSSPALASKRGHKFGRKWTQNGRTTERQNLQECSDYIPLFCCWAGAWCCSGNSPERSG